LKIEISGLIFGGRRSIRQNFSDLKVLKPDSLRTLFSKAIILLVCEAEPWGILFE